MLLLLLQLPASGRAARLQPPPVLQNAGRTGCASYLWPATPACTSGSAVMMGWQPGSQWILYKVSGSSNSYFIAWTTGACQRYLGAPRSCQDTALKLFAGTSPAVASLVWEVTAVAGGEPVPAAVEVASVAARSGNTVDVVVGKAATPGECKGGRAACGSACKAWRAGPGPELARPAAASPSLALLFPRAAQCSSMLSPAPPWAAAPRCSRRAPARRSAPTRHAPRA